MYKGIDFSSTLREIRSKKKTRKLLKLLQNRSLFIAR